MNQTKAIFLIFIIAFVSASRLRTEDGFWKDNYDRVKNGTMKQLGKAILSPIYFVLQVGGQAVVCPLIRVVLRLLYGSKAVLSRNEEQFNTVVDRMERVDNGVCKAVEKTVDVAADVVTSPLVVLDVAKEAIREALRFVVTILNPVEVYRIIRDALKRDNIELKENPQDFEEFQ